MLIRLIDFCVLDFWQDLDFIYIFTENWLSVEIECDKLPVRKFLK